MTGTPQLLTVDEAAALLKVKKSWLYEKRHFGTLPFPAVKVGFYLRFRQTDIEAFIERQLEPAGSNGGG